MPGERFLSRRHILLRPGECSVEVERAADARNPVFFRGKPADRFTLSPGEYFVVGETSFCLVASGRSRVPVGPGGGEPQPFEEFALGPDELQAPRRPGDRLILLDLMELPEVLRTRNRQDFFLFACGLLRRAAAASWARVLTLKDDEIFILTEDAPDDRPQDRPISRALVAAATAQTSRPVSYSWNRPAAASMQATQHEGIDWAVACAVSIPGEEDVIFYMAGSDARPTHRSAAGDEPMSLLDVARMAGFIADMIGRTLSLHKMENWQARLGRFFPAKLSAKLLETDSIEALEPKIAEATVMFFDIRGFSHRAESNLDAILELQGHRKDVMTDMTQLIFDHDGIVLSYIGDGILAA